MSALRKEWIREMMGLGFDARVLAANAAQASPKVVVHVHFHGSVKKNAIWLLRDNSRHSALKAALKVA